MKRLFSTLILTSCLLTGLPLTTLAQGGSGFILWGGPKDPDFRLSYHTDFGARPGSWDRYRLRLSSKQMKMAVSQFSITYPEYFTGSFDPNAVEVMVGDESIPLESVRWDQENRELRIVPKQPIPAGKNVELMLSNVRNPDFGGMYNFNCNIQSPGDVPLLRYVGTWTVSIG